jgi:hypothetical protein
VSLQSLIDRLTPKKAEPFIAPITPVTKTIYARIDGLPFKFGRDALPDGWRRCIPIHNNRNLGVMIPGAAEWEINSYLELYKPHWTLIVCYRLGDTSWLCYPYNQGDAAQKGWGEGPVVVNLVRDTIEPFDVIVAAGPVYNLIYWRPSEAKVRRNEMLAGLANTLVDPYRPRTGEELKALQIAIGRIVERRRLEAEKSRQNALKTVEGRLKYNLEFLGAELVSWRESGRDIIVTWRDEGREYQSRISSGMSVVTAGICLSGRDRAFNVAALVDVMREARQLNRPGAGGDDDDD